jgi:hypothetical protein
MSLPAAVEWSLETVRREAAVARAALYYKERNSAEPLVVEPRWASRWPRTATFAIARLVCHSFALFDREPNDNCLDKQDRCCMHCWAQAWNANYLFENEYQADLNGSVNNDNNILTNDKSRVIV